MSTRVNDSRSAAKVVVMQRCHQRDLSGHLLEQGGYKKQSPDADGWVRSPAAGIEMKQGRKGKLAIRLAGDDATFAELPEN